MTLRHGLSKSLLENIGKYSILKLLVRLRGFNNAKKVEISTEVYTAGKANISVLMDADVRLKNYEHLMYLLAHACSTRKEFESIRPIFK